MTDRVLDRIPPQSIEAEMALLGSALLDRAIMDAAAEMLEPSDFYARAHETLYAAMLSLWRSGHPIDLISLATYLRDQGQLARVGDTSYLRLLTDTVQSIGSATYYATLIAEKSTLRKLISAAGGITRLAFDGESDVEGAVDQSEALIYSVSMGRDGSTGVDMQTATKNLFEDLARTDVPFRPTGFPLLDHLTSGFHGGELHILAARPGMGKTSLALAITLAIARDVQKKRERAKVFFASLEMGETELMKRILAMEGRLDLGVIRRRELAATDWEVAGEAMATMGDLPIHIDDTAALPVSQLRSRARRLRSTHGLAAIFIDYLQLLMPNVRRRGDLSPQNRNEELADISRSLKATAKELDVPIIALSQLNRGVETRSEKRPTLSDLRDSGAIEQEADLVGLLYRDSYYSKDPHDDSAELNIAKQRNGPTGMIPLRFDGPTTLYTPQ